MAGSQANLWKMALINPSGTADANTIALLNRHGPKFRVPVDNTGAVVTATVAGTVSVPTTSVKTDNFFFWDNSMIAVVIRPGITPPNAAELINISA